MSTAIQHPIRIPIHRTDRCEGRFQMKSLAERLFPDQKLRELYLHLIERGYASEVARQAVEHFGSRALASPDPHSLIERFASGDSSDLLR